MKWSDLEPLLSPRLIELLLENKFPFPTPVQTAVVPEFLSRKDVAVEAATGSGKTLAFLVPIFQLLLNLEEPLRKNQIGVLIVEPTRELTMQTFNTARLFAEKLEFSLAILTGGADELQCSPANIVVGTPGRLSTFLTKPDVIPYVKSLEMLILDEADRLYSSEQIEDVRTIIRSLPKQRRTGLFSATLVDNSDVLSESGMRNPIEIKVKSTNASSNTENIPEGLNLFYAKVLPADKFALLVSFLKSRPKEKFIVFFSTCAAVEYFSAVLRCFLDKNASVFWIHGKIDKLSRRFKIFKRFQSSGGVLVSTDLMSRGVDFPDVDWVIQFDPPSNPATFIHRCGRTARLNRIGSAVVFLLPNEIEYVRFIEKNQNILVEKLDTSYLGDLNSDQVLKEMRKLCADDRDVFEKSSRAFVSFIQFYRKHECNLIFQMKELEIGQLAYAYGLLMMPRMPEIRSFSARIKSFEPVPDMKPSDISFKDANREKQRQEMLSKKQTEPKKVKNEATSRRDMLRKERTMRKQKEKKKKELKAKRRADQDSDWEELARDAKLIKRLKSGKMSEKEFERAMGLSSDDN